MDRDDRAATAASHLSHLADLAPAGPRKPYERPAVIGEEVFETLALSCGKTASNPMGILDCTISASS